MDGTPFTAGRGGDLHSSRTRGLRDVPKHPLPRGASIPGIPRVCGDSLSRAALEELFDLRTSLARTASFVAVIFRLNWYYPSKFCCRIGARSFIHH